MTQRNKAIGTAPKNNWEHLDDEKTCRICGNTKHWTSRGKQQPEYMYKCTKCGEKS
jgi:transcription elongation factor Elf1